jgi:glycosyltransferase involved in cell wall biosynthesis
VTVASRTVTRVGINAVFLQPRMGGIETYVRNLVPALLAVQPSLDLSVFVNRAGRDLLADEPWAAGVRLITHPLLGRRYTRAITELTVLGWLASRQRLDVLHSVALTGPLVTRPAHVVTIGDVTWIRHPDPAELRTVRIWKVLVPPVARRAELVLTYSEDSRLEVAEDLRIPLERIAAIPLGPGTSRSVEPTAESEVRSRLSLGNGPVVLAVSALKEHKNVGRLIEAMALVRRDVADAVLVVPANATPLQADLEHTAAALGIREAVVFPGWVDDADLEGLYRCAACLAIPSLREGFGLPVLEAMRRSIPVASSRTSALPEVGGDAVLYFDPKRVEEIAAAISKLLTEPGLAAEIVAKGIKRQEAFTWERTAEETLAAYERAVSNR